MTTDDLVKKAKEEGHRNIHRPMDSVFDIVQKPLIKEIERLNRIINGDIRMTTAHVDRIAELETKFLEKEQAFNKLKEENQELKKKLGLSVPIPTNKCSEPTGITMKSLRESGERK